MSILTPIATVLSVFVAYYFGQKSRTTPLRSAAYSKQVDLAHEVSRKVDEWHREMLNTYSEMNSIDRGASDEGKQKVLQRQVQAAETAHEAIRTVQHCEILLPSGIIEEMDDVVQALLARNLKVSALATEKAPVEPAEAEGFTSAGTAERIEEAGNTDVEKLRNNYREACSSFRETCREEFGIETLSDETKQAVEQLEREALPQLRES